MCRVTGVCRGTQRSHHLARVSEEQLMVEQSVKIGWKHLSFVVFPDTTSASGSLLCLHESVTTLTCTMKCDCNVIMKDNEIQKGNIATVNELKIVVHIIPNITRTPPV